MKCREGCAACCIAPSISTPIPGMPEGKPAGVPCLQLNEAGLCRLFGKLERPKVCGQLNASLEMCGHCTEDALAYLEDLEKRTAPVKK